MRSANALGDRSGAMGHAEQSSAALSGIRARSRQMITGTVPPSALQAAPVT